jgi:hypothetical protein
VQKSNVIFDNSTAASRASSEIAKTLSFFVSMSLSLNAICCENASSHIIHSSGEIGLVPGSFGYVVSYGISFWNINLHPFADFMINNDKNYGRFQA